jgi:hypothetical protein
VRELAKVVKVIKSGELTKGQADGHRRDRGCQGGHRGGRRRWPDAGPSEID